MSDTPTETPKKKRGRPFGHKPPKVTKSIKVSEHDWDEFNLFCNMMGKTASEVIGIVIKKLALTTSTKEEYEVQNKLFKLLDLPVFEYHEKKEGLKSAIERYKARKEAAIRARTDFKNSVEK